MARREYAGRSGRRRPAGLGTEGRHSGFLRHVDGQAASGGAYGLSGVEQTLARHKDHSLNQVLKALFQDSHAFTGGHGRHDDTTVVLIERS
jgi:hypothetical protein